MVSSEFYRALRRNLGSGDQLVEKKLYLSILEAVEPTVRSRNALHYGFEDTGWLSILADRGWTVVDVVPKLDNALAEARAVVGYDPVTHIRSQPPEATDLISGFHLAERLSAEDLIAFIEEARRALRPGGILILETANPENLLVGSNRFYLDPTFKRPTPPEYLKFVARHSGFEFVDVVGVGVLPQARGSSPSDLFRKCLEVPPDYILVARNPGYNATAASGDPLAANLWKHSAFAAQAYNDFENSLLEISGRIGEAQRLANMADAIRKTEELSRLQLVLSKQIAQLEKRIKRLRRHSAVLTPITAPVVGSEFTNIFHSGRKYVSLLASSSYVVIIPGAGSSLKKWPKEYYGELGRLIRSEIGVKVVVLGGEREKEYAEAIEKASRPGDSLNLTMKTSIIESMNIIASALAVVGNDTGLTHFAALTNIPTVCIFSGVVDVNVWSPIGKHVVCLKNYVQCSPCRLIEEKDCYADHACMRRISVLEVYSELRTLIDRAGDGVDTIRTQKYAPEIGGGNLESSLSAKASQSHIGHG
jgi:O-antigen chain-terminating methyltransferase